MLLRRVVFPDFCEPCLPSPAAKPPAGAGGLHEITHDGFRLLVRRDAAAVRLFTRNELDGDDLRREPIERRKVLLIRLLAKASVGLQVNDHIVEPGDVVFRHARLLGLEGIVSKRLGSPYASGRSREQEEDWGKERWR